MRTAIDSNVISALWSNEPSSARILSLLDEIRREGSLVICAPVYAELLAYPTATLDFVHGFLQDGDISIDFDLREEIWQRAGIAFAQYAGRRRKSAANFPRRMLVDFVVGAHAILKADRLFTFDKSPYRQSFPSLRLSS